MFQGIQGHPLLRLQRSSSALPGKGRDDRDLPSTFLYHLYPRFASHSYTPSALFYLPLFSSWAKVHSLKRRTHISTQTTASEIQNSPLFTTLDLAVHNKQQWFQIIVRKFTNYRNNIYLKKKSPPTQTQSPTKGASLVSFSSVLTGRQLFAREQADIINKAITERLATSEHTSTAAIYQSVLKEMWESLSLEDQETWKTKASNEAGDVAK
ncbi:hypothetical protein C8J57DRAFT_1520885 [Mycena rebaudengoi]|nr:hypothetical protein C8J57DRAFT_1520885 [Mycena rebaudengoi]